MFITLMLAVYIVTKLVPICFMAVCMGSSIASIMTLTLAVFVGMILPLGLGKFGYSIFSGKVPS